MAKENEQSTNNDILSGNGLKPITVPQPTTTPTGLISENRGLNSSGLRLDLFGLNRDKGDHNE